MNFEEIIEFHKKHIGWVFGITMIFIIIALVLVGLGGIKGHNKTALGFAIAILSIIGMHQMIISFGIGGSFAGDKANELGDKARGLVQDLGAARDKFKDARENRLNNAAPVVGSYENDPLMNES
jgi:hypothetical protein